MIELDVPARRCTSRSPTRSWRRGSRPGSRRSSGRTGAGTQLYYDHVGGADTGADLDFLMGCRGTPWRGSRTDGRRVRRGAGRRRQDRARPAPAGDRRRPGLRARRRACPATRRSTGVPNFTRPRRLPRRRAGGGGGALRAAGGADGDGGEGARGRARRAAREAAGGDARRGRARWSAAARRTGAVLFATWHSRFAPAVPAAKAWLAGQDGRARWRSSGRRTCGAGTRGRRGSGSRRGFGVFDPGINALSILTEILPGRLRRRRRALSFPENCETPIAAELRDDRGGGLSGDVGARLAAGGAADLGHHRRDRRGAGSASRSAGRRWPSMARRSSRGAGPGVSRDLPPLRRAARGARERRGRGPLAHLRRRLPARRAASSSTPFTTDAAQEKRGRQTMTTRPYSGIWPVAPTPFTDDGAARPRGDEAGHRLHGRPGGRRHLHPRQLLRAVPALGRGAGGADEAEPRACRRAGADHRHRLALRDAGRRGPRPRGRGDGRGDGDDDAALPRGGPPRRRGGRLRALRAGGEGGRHPDHGAGRADGGDDALGALPRAHGARDRGR